MARKINTVRWSPEAEYDLDLIIDYYARMESLVSGEKITRVINASVQSLRKQPLLWRERPNLQRGIRAIPVEPYLVFYRTNNASSEIVRVLHGQRDIRAILKKMRKKL